jgi:ABC-type Fe3+-hydroxamate transport system substrate-binding protein
LRRVFCEALGVELKLADIPRRIISLSPAATETLFDVGLGEDIVGVSAFCVPPKAITDPNLYVEIDFAEPVTFGAYSYITDAIALLGGHNIYGTELAEWLSPDFNQVAEIDPDVIFYEAKMFKPFTDNDLARLIRSRSWDNVRAARNGRVYLAPRPYDFLAHHGPSFITQAIPWLSNRLKITR